MDPESLLWEGFADEREREDPLCDGGIPYAVIHARKCQAVQGSGRGPHWSGLREPLASEPLYEIHVE